MSDSFYDEKKYNERRKHPRIKAQCQVNYFARSTGNWSEARLEDYSAGGICFVCDQTLPQNTKITVQVTHGAHEMVPAIAASAVVIRCEQDDEDQFKVACKFTKVRQENVPRISRFGPGHR